MKDESLSDGIADTVASPQFIELAADVGDFTLDRVIGSEVLEGIPGLGLLAKACSAVRSISDRMLFQKILRFLKALESINPKEKAEFTRMVEIDRDFRRKVGERLLLALDKLDEPGKIAILAKCFDHFLTGHLDYDQFSELAHVIDRAFLTDLRNLAATPQGPLQHEERMVASGLATMSTRERDGFVRSKGVQLVYGLSEVGIRLQEILRGTFRKTKGSKRYVEVLWGKPQG